eukprot:1580452-Ditylum_brightwellii.AAC.1
MHPGPPPLSSIHSRQAKLPLSSGVEVSCFPRRICGEFPVLVGYLRSSLLVPGRFLGSNGDVALCVGFPHALGHRIEAT